MTRLAKGDGTGPVADALPVRAALAELGEALARARRAVLVAPPGSGKTTLVAPWLLGSGLVAARPGAGGGEIVLLQPRRVAARAVARHMAAARGEAVGETVGYQVRFESKVSSRTRIRVVTEGILTARLQNDPSLEGVTAVILDEFHERSLHADLALALVKEIQDVLREDLLLIVMSATLDAGPIARFLGDCPIVSAPGRAFPVTLDYAAGDAGSTDAGAAGRAGTFGRPRRIEDVMADGVLDVLEAGVTGDVLGFLPGVRMIEAARDRLAEPLRRRGRDVVVLHGSLDAREQDLALTPGTRPRVVLATNIAETSLTIPGVTAVVDAGLAKVMRYDLGVGSERLETERISLASADQRAGRAGRTAPGHALRLWSAFEQQRLASFTEPEIRRVDLARLVLELRSWGVPDLRTFPFFEAPDPKQLEDAERRLRVLGALDDRGVTALGRALTKVPADPRVAAFMLAAGTRERPEAARWSALIEEGRDGGDIHGAAQRMPESVRRAAEQLGRVTASEAAAAGRGLPAARASLEGALLAGYADRVGVRRDDGTYQLVGGRRGKAEGIQAPYVVALTLEAGRRTEGALSTIRLAAAVTRGEIEAHPAFRWEDALVWDPQAARVVSSRVARFFDLALETKPTPNVNRAESGAILAEAARGALAHVFGQLAPEDEAMLARLATLARAFPELGLATTREAWLEAALPAICEGLTSFEELRRRPAVPLRRAWLEGLEPKTERRLREALPEARAVPSGRHASLVYQLSGDPVLAVKVQELFGLGTSPTLAGGRVPVVLHLLSPAGRPLQVTRDLASFWTRTWPAVRAEMRTRYPRHFWPEDPAAALPSTRTTARRFRDED